MLAASPYIATFNCPDIGIVDEQIEVPAIPPLISPEFEQQVIERFEHNRCYSKPGHENRYLLQSFVFCAQCGRAISAAMQKSGAYYLHPTNKGKPCIKTIRLDNLEPAVLDYLFKFFFDESAFEKAIENELPSDDQRQKLAKEIERVQKQWRKIQRQIENILNAIAEADPDIDISLLLNKQNDLKKENDILNERVEELQNELDSLPDPVLVKEQGEVVRRELFKKYANRDWRKLSKDEVQEFLFFLFGDNRKKTGKGIFIDQIDGKTIVTFKGRFSDSTEIVDGRPLFASMKNENEHLKSLADKRQKLAGLKHQEREQDSEQQIQEAEKILLTSDTWVGMLSSYSNGEIN